MCCAIADPPPFNPHPPVFSSPHNLRLFCGRIDSRQQWTCNSRNENFLFNHRFPFMAACFGPTAVRFCPAPNMYGFFLSRSDGALRHAEFLDRSPEEELSCIVPHHSDIFFRNPYKWHDLFLPKAKDVSVGCRAMVTACKKNLECKLHNYVDVVWLLSIIITVTTPRPCYALLLTYLSSLCSSHIIYLLCLIILFVSFWLVTLSKQDKVTFLVLRNTSDDENLSALSRYKGKKRMCYYKMSFTFYDLQVLSFRFSFLVFLQLLYRCRRFPLPLSTTWRARPSPRATTWSATPRTPRGTGRGAHITKSRATLNRITSCKLPMEMYSCQIVSAS